MSDMGTTLVCHANPVYGFLFDAIHGEPDAT
jgi:hypothetical protein